MFGALIVLRHLTPFPGKIAVALHHFSILLQNLLGNNRAHSSLNGSSNKVMGKSTKSNAHALI